MSLCGKPHCKQAKTCEIRRSESARRARRLVTALTGYGLVLAGLMGMAAGAALWLAKHGAA